jgi:hypothetical protein
LLDVRNDLKNPELRSFLKQAKTKSNLDMDLVSAASLSASLSFETKAAWYRLFLQASAKFLHTERTA